tara:strand:+ start:714 stop:1034 length:321 start_codon:yes stop_codon:yes gene_type:complete
MAVSIISYDIAGSSYTNFIGVDYRKEAAVRKFLVDGDTVKDKVALIEDIRALLTTGSMNHHPNTEGSSSADGYKGLLPLQSINVTKVGTMADGKNLWIAEARYGYN